MKSPETQKEFQKALGVELDGTSYDKIAQAAGLMAQQNDIIGVDEKKDANVDITLEDILKKYQEKYY